MARHYSIRDLFRQMPNTLLARYFEARGMFSDLDFAAMRETQPDRLFAAWLDLPDTRRNEMDAEFRDIFDLSCEKGFRAILDEAEWHLAHDAVARTAFVEKLAALLNHFERAMARRRDADPGLMHRSVRASGWRASRYNFSIQQPVQSLLRSQQVFL